MPNSTTMTSRHDSQDNHGATSATQSFANSSSSLPLALSASHTFPEKYTRVSSLKKKKGLSQFIPGKSDRARVQTMAQVPQSQRQASAQSCHNRPMTLGPNPTAFKARREERQSHWAPASESRRFQLPIRRSASPQKLELPFIEGCHQIGSRFSINTLMNAVEEVIPKTQKDLNFLHQDTYSMADRRSSQTSKVKGPYQPRSLLTRTKSYYRLNKPCTGSALPRRGSDESAYSDDGPSSFEDNDGSAKTDRSSEEDDYQYLNWGVHPVQGSHLQAVKEEEEHEIADYATQANTFEPWVLDALQSPVRFNSRFSSSEVSNNQPKARPSLTRPTEGRSHQHPPSAPRMDSISNPNHHTQYLQDLVSLAPTPTAPLNIRKSYQHAPQSSAASYVSETHSSAQEKVPTGPTLPTTVRGQPSTKGPPILVAQPWARARTQKPRQARPKTSQAQPTISTDHLRTLTPSFVPLSTPRRQVPNNAGPPSRRRDVMSTGVTSVEVSPVYSEVYQSQYNHAFETPRPAPARPSRS